MAAFAALALGASVLGLTAVALYAGTSEYVPGSLFNHPPSVIPVSADVQRPAAARMSEPGTAAQTSLFGNRVWVKGFMHRPSSCALLPEGVTPEQDAKAANPEAAIVGARASGSGYDVIYTGGAYTSVYSSSVPECRRIVSRWNWWIDL